MNMATFYYLKLSNAVIIPEFPKNILSALIEKNKAKQQNHHL